MNVSANLERTSSTLPPQRFVGLHPSALAYALSRLSLGVDLTSYQRRDLRGAIGTPRQVVAIVASASVAEQLCNDLGRFIPSRADSQATGKVPEWDVLPFDAISPSSEVIAERIRGLDLLERGIPGVVVVSATALAQRVMAPATLRTNRFTLQVGQAIERDFLVTALIDLGYLRTTVCEEVGQIAVRGAVLDVYSPGMENPLRIELFEDKIEALRYFDPASQRSLSPGSLSADSFLQESQILPATEIVFSTANSLATLQDGKSRTGDERARAAAWLRERGADLGVPTRTLEATVEVLEQGGYWPGMEHLLPGLTPNVVSLADYISHEACVVLCDELAIVNALDSFHELVKERAAQALAEERVFPDPAASFLLGPDSLAPVKAVARAFFDTLHFAALSESDFSGGDEELTRPMLQTGARLPFESTARLHSELKRARHSELPLKPLADYIRSEQERGLDVSILVSHPPKAKRVEEMLSHYDISTSRHEGDGISWINSLSRTGTKKGSPVSIQLGYLSEGFSSPVDGFTIITDHEVFPEISGRKPSRSASKIRRILGAASQLKENDFVVHIDHGVAVYRGLKSVTIEHKTSDYLTLEYAEGAKLFVPVDNIGKVQKYVASEGRAPTLSKLGGKAWAKTKEKVKQNVVELAGQLINLYASREMVEGFSFGERDADDEEFASTFQFTETPDQEKAINDVLNDMSQPKPMDRLVCGDVGFGKTEVALRAAFKAVSKGKQVAFLVPTTILADQHYATFQSRLRQFSYRVGCISRFYSPVENKKTLEKVANGEIDVIIGTHRLLQKDVYFKNLGLLMVDEEHRFGVADKEKLKRIRKEIDVLTLTATPIPRTLYMSLFDIRDLSVIETPPTDRQVIRTYLAPYHESIVREAIMRELGRKGQVFLIHNRVANIAAVADELKQLVPEARVVYAHGQMKEDELEKVMHSFILHEADVLVSTTIVESGLDISNANTIIIKDSDKLGLAELYQLRGRVGRSSRRAYAYLLISDSRTLGDDAKKRLQVLQSLDDLGMGFRLALQDMEIRGAGNLLGKDQSGKIELVGFDLYSRILKEAVREIRSRRGDLPASNRALALEALIDPELNIGFPVHIPEYYVPDVEERLLMYQRLVDIRDEAEARDIAEELEDRFGNLPSEVEILLEVMVFRGLLRRAGIVSAFYRNGTMNLAFHRDVKLPADRLLERIQNSRGRLKLSPAMVLTAKIAEEVETPEVLTRETRDILRSIGHAVS